MTRLQTCVGTACLRFVGQPLVFNMKTLTIAITTFAVTAALFGRSIQRDFVPRVAPPITASATDFSGILAPNTLLRDSVELLLKGQIHGAETIAEMEDGSLLICTDDGWLQRIHIQDSQPRLEKVRQL